MISSFGAFMILTIININMIDYSVSSSQDVITDMKTSDNHMTPSLHNGIDNVGKDSHDGTWEDNVGLWAVADFDTNSKCILLKGAMKITLSIGKDPNKQIIELNVPKEAKADGLCASLWNDFQQITLSWNETLSNHSDITMNSLTLVFATNWTSEFKDNLEIPANQYALNSIEVEQSVYPSKNDTNNITVTASDLTEFLTPKNSSFACLSKQSLDYHTVVLQLYALQVEAFRNLSTTEFSDSVFCSPDVRKDHIKMVFTIIWVLTIVFLICLVTTFVVLRRRCVSGSSDNGYRLLE